LDILLDQQLLINLEFGALCPSRATAGSVGFDLCSIEDGTIPPKSRKLVSTGLKVQFPLNKYGKIESRSSLALKGIDVGAGLIDNDYTGVIKVLLINNMDTKFSYGSTDKIAQLVIHEFKPCVPYIGKITNTSRGDGGFGSTDKK